jgi:esterase/lipase superfamily enzyme
LPEGVIVRIKGLLGGLTMFCLAAGLSGCTFSDSLRNDEIRSVWTSAAPVTAEVFFVTDRSREGDSFGLHWGAALHCGMARLAVPSATSAQAVQQPDLEVQPCDTPARMDEFTAGILARARARNCRDVLVIVPGYNTSFRTGLLRAGQAGADMQWPCATLIFSWSSEGKFDRYVADIERSEYAVPPFGALLVALKVKGLKANIFSQSMGSWITLRALWENCGATSPLVNELVLAAPDIGAERGNDDFGQFLRKASPCAGRVTIYASDYDTALITSESVHGGIPRAGRLPVENMQYLSGDFGTNIDLVDASLAPDDAVGHGYFFMSYEMLHDLMWVFAGEPIARRAALDGRAGQTLVCYPADAACPNKRYVLNVESARRPEWTRRLLRLLWPLLSPIE